MYTILICDDNSLYGSQKCTILQKEKLVNKLQFLVAPYYNGIDMSRATVLMRYLLPISKEYKTEILTLSDERYEDYLKYVLPVDSGLTKEFGDIELNLTFVLLDADENGDIVQRVRKTTNCIVTVTKITDWDAIIPDDSLAALDQRIIAQSAQILALQDLANTLESNNVDNLVFNDEDDTLQLAAKGKPIGNKVLVRNMIDDGVPVVDLNSNVNIPESPIGEDNVVEF